MWVSAVSIVMGSADASGRLREEYVMLLDEV